MGAIITQKQNNKPWTLTWKASGRYPMVADRIYATLKDAQDYVDDLTATASATPGLVLSVVSDPVAKNNGIYYVQSIAQAATETTEFVPGVLVAAGAGAGSEAVANYVAAVAAATSDNLGQILYVINPTYKKGEGTTLNPDEADVDEEGNKIVVYTAGPYIVTGAGAVAKLGTTSATGDIAGDVENLKGRVSTAEGEIDTLQTDVNTLKTAVGNADSGLVKDVADNAAEIATLKGAIAGGVHFKGIKAELPWDGDKLIVNEGDWAPRDEGEESEPYETYEEYVRAELEGYQVGDIIIVSPENDDTEPDSALNPSREYILVQETLQSTDPNDRYRWEDLGDTTAEGQRISALESLIDSDKATTWTTGATQAATLTANISNYALKTEVADGYVAKETGKSLVDNTLITKLDGLKEIKDVAADSVLSVDTNGILTADLSGYVAKDTEYTNLVSKVGGVEDGAQVNKIEIVKVNGSALTITDKAVDIDLVNNLAGKVSINGQVLAETDDNGVLSATIDASDIHLGTNIGDNDAATTTVQSLLASVYDTANSKLGSIYLAKDDATTANVLTLSKTNAANDTIAFKIATDSALKATTNGLDLVWTEL